MAAPCESPVYAKGFLVGSDKDWFHGELTRVQAEHVLTVSQRNCFLVRVDEGTLILSLSHHGQVHHINIKYGPGWYELESGSAQYSFTELEELVSHYSETAINDLKVTLGAVCQKTTTQGLPHHFDYISNNIYSRGEPEDLVKQSWYHGKITEKQANAKLSYYSHDCFFARQSCGKIFLSKKLRGCISHTSIWYSPKGYKMEGNKRLFSSIPELIASYQDSIGTPLESSLKSKPFRKEKKILQVSWKRCADLPVALSAPHVVKIGEEDIYMGGGMVAEEDAIANRIFKYNLSTNIWTSLPPCETVYHSLTALNSELLAIGGYGYANGRPTCTVRTFRDSEWKKILPPMKIPRWNLSTISHENKIIIAAGGLTMVNNEDPVRIKAVEVFETDKQVWYETKKLPFPLALPKLCFIGDTCYTLGGMTRAEDNIKTALHASVSSLLNPRPSTPQVTWKKLKDQHPLVLPTPMELAGILVAMGGSAKLTLHGTEFISAYDFATDTWVECKGATLPIPLYRTGVVKLDDSQIMIIGGEQKTKHFSAAVYIGNYKMS